MFRQHCNVTTGLVNRDQNVCNLRGCVGGEQVPRAVAFHVGLLGFKSSLFAMKLSD